MNIFNSWQFYVIVSIFADVVFTQGYKLAVRNTKNYSAATILLELIAGISILVFVPFFPFTVSNNPFIYILFFLSTFFGAINDRLKTTARKYLPASEASILNQLYIVGVIIIGFTVFRQPLIFGKIAGAILILGANVYLSYEKGKFKINKYMLLFITACISLSISLSLDIGISKYFNLAFYVAAVYIASALYIYLGSKQKPKEITKELNSKGKKYYLLTGIAWSISFISILRAAQLGPLIVVMPLLTLSILLNIFVATKTHKETQNLGKKIIVAVIVIAGVILTNVY